jgi:divalent metal cation (Fe/Co/Zn/Cd) transporter
VSTPELTTLPSAAQAAPPAIRRDAGWLRAARQAKWLAWASLVWMGLEGGLGIFAGIQAHSLGVVTWAASSFVEALASLIVVWRFTGHRMLSASSEARAQRWVAASFFLLAPYFVIEAVRKLISGEGADATVLAIALTSSAVVLMPLLGFAKLRLGRRLGSGATAGEGTQNLLCAGQALAALVAVVGAGAGLAFLDPLAALAIAAVALHEGLEGWRGEACCDPVVPDQHDDCEDECECAGAAHEGKSSGTSVGDRASN